MLESTNKNIDLREYWQIFWRRKYFFIIPFVIAIITGIVMSYVMQPVYESSTIVQVSQSRLLSREMQRLVPGVTAHDRIENLRRLITSHDYLKRLIETLNLYSDPEMQALAEENKDKYPGMTLKEINEILWIEQLKRFLSIRQLGADFVKVSAYSHTPELAYNFAKTLTQIFIDESLRREVGGIRGALEFSTEQLTIYKRKLEDSEEKLRRYKEKTVQDQFDEKSVVSSNFDQVKSMLTSIDFELREAQDRLSFLSKRIITSGTKYRTPNSTRLKKLKKQLLNATLELPKLMLKYSWQDVKVLKMNANIEKLREQIQNEIEIELKTRYKTGNGTDLDLIVQKEIAAMEVDFLQQRKQSLENLKQEYKRSLAKAPTRELELNRLRREVEANRIIYQTLLQQTQGSEIEEALQRTAAEFKFKIVEPAIKPIRPIKPNRLKLLLMAMVVGSLIGGGLIFLLEYTDHSFKNVEEVEKFLNLPVLGTIPKIDMDQHKKY